MTDIAIRVDNPCPACPEHSRRKRSRRVSKRCRIGGKQARYRTLRDTLTGALAAPFRRLSSVARSGGRSSVVAPETICALKDVSFEVARGEVVGTLAPRCGCSAGVIGRNGAGTGHKATPC